MRVNDSTASQRSADMARTGRFGEALRRARAGNAAARGAATASTAGRRPETRRAAALRGEQAEAVRREEARAAATTDPARAGAPPEDAAVPELAALVRTLPVAIAAARAREGAPLALSFGRSLDVELRSGAAGVEVLLRPEPRLLRAAEAELPRVLAALRLRGIAVARAEVRARGGGDRRTR
jgi:hypothetical protein